MFYNIATQLISYVRLNSKKRELHTEFTYEEYTISVFKNDLLYYIYFFQVKCSARARHVTIGTKTETLFSKPFFAGIRIKSSKVVRIQPGEQIEQVRFQSTVAPKCVFPRFHRPQKCCVEIEFDMKSAEGSINSCTKQGLTLNLPTCQMQVG